LTYCIADIHGCYDEFMRLLKQINFSETDTLYVLGDVIDRGPQSLECISYVRSRKNIICLMGNHEHLMLDFFENSYKYNDDEFRYHDWIMNGGKQTMQQIQQNENLPAGFSSDTDKRFAEVLEWLRSLPFYVEIEVGGKEFFLSHAGCNARKTFQKERDYIWSREEFFKHKGLEGKHHIFGHTPVWDLHEIFGGERVIDECYNTAIWVDIRYGDKTCIDSGCYFGGALAAYRLDDGAVFYESALPEPDMDSFMDFLEGIDIAEILQFEEDEELR
jgi:serine/threonine protein phosphatase 1